MNMITKKICGVTGPFLIVLFNVMYQLHHWLTIVIVFNNIKIKCESDLDNSVKH